MRAALCVVVFLLAGCVERPLPDASGPFVIPCPTSLPTAIDFGEVESGVTVRRDLGLSSIGNPTFLTSVGAPFTVSFSQVVNFRQLNLSFTPMDARAYVATLRFNPAPDCPEVEMVLSGSGTGRLVVSHPEVDFGNLLQGEASERQIIATNTRRAPVDVTASISVAWVSVQPRTFTLAPGQSQTLTLNANFEFGEQLAALDLRTALDRLAVPLRMNGLSPRLAFVTFQGPQSTLLVPNFGAPDFLERTIALRNFGSLDLTVSGLDFTGGPGPTVITDAGVIVIAPDAEVPVTLRFPTNMPDGLYDVVLRASSNDPLRPDAGLALRVESRTMDQCGPLDFPRTLVDAMGDGGSGAEVIITNTSAVVSCLLDDVHIEDDFLPTPTQRILGPGNSTSYWVRPGSSGIARLRFRPMRVGSTYEEITITR